MSKEIDKEIHFEIKENLTSIHLSVMAQKTVVLLNIANENIEFIQQKVIREKNAAKVPLLLLKTA